MLSSFVVLLSSLVFVLYSVVFTQNSRVNGIYSRAFLHLLPSKHVLLLSKVLLLPSKVVLLPSKVLLLLSFHPKLTSKAPKLPSCGETPVNIEEKDLSFDSKPKIFLPKGENDAKNYITKELFLKKLFFKGLEKKKFSFYEVVFGR